MTLEQKSLPVKKIHSGEGVNPSLMAIGAHADDIEINVGGTLLKYHALGYAVEYIMSTNNMSGRFRTKNPDGTLNRTNTPWDVMMPTRKKEAAAAAAAVGAEVIHLNHPQRHFYNAEGRQEEVRYGSARPGEIGPEIPTILTAHEDAQAVTRLADLILERNPEAVLVHGMVAAQSNMEHVGTCLLTTKAFRQALDKGYQGMLLYWLESDLSLFGDAYQRWDTHIDVTDSWKQKMDWIRYHASVVLEPEEIYYAPRDAACHCGKVEAFDIAYRGRNGLGETPFGIEISKNIASQACSG